MKRKYGVIIRIPNFILTNFEDYLFEKEVCILIKKHMNIEVYQCKIDIKQEFETDISLVRLTSSRKVNGLAEYSYYGEFLQKNFPVEKVIK